MSFGFGFGARSGANTIWSPASLFAQNEPGVWYDPSDLTTLFQDAAGTTPVTAVEQPVGLMLDKSRGLVLGSEVVTNGDFSNGSTGWTLDPTISISSGALVFNTVDTNAYATNVGAVVAGQTYKVVFTLTNFASGGISLSNNGASVGSVFTANGVCTQIVTATQSGFIAVRARFSATVATVDNISVRELPGTHATSLTTSRPVLTARVNLLRYSQEWSNAIWTKQNVTTTGNADVAPDGTTTATRYLAAGGAQHFIGQVWSPSTGLTYTVSYWVKSNTGVNQNFRNLINGVFSADQIATTSWQRFLFTFTGNSGFVTIYPIISTAANDALDILVWGASLTTTDQASLGYQRVNTATDYDTVGFPMWLKADGVDDYMVTGTLAAPVNLNLSTTDKVTVSTGVRKLSDASIGIVTELSSGSLNGSFFFAAPRNSGSPDYGWRSKGTLSITDAVASGYTSPITNVFSGLGDISGDLATLRINGAQVAQSTADQGTGNYGTYPLYQFARAGTSLPFNGLSAGLTVVGRTLTAAELSQLETYYQQKTKAY